jgi:hypothetical protein
MLLCRTWPLPYSSGKTSGRAAFALLSLSHKPALLKNLRMPVPGLKVAIVLPSLIRSFFADKIRATNILQIANIDVDISLFRRILSCR